MTSAERNKDYLQYYLHTFNAFAAIEFPFRMILPREDVRPLDEY